MIGKTYISKEFKKLEQQGYICFNFNNYRAYSPGLKHFPDYVIIGHGTAYFIEMKLGKDKLSEGQRETRHELEYCCERNPFLFYLICTEENYSRIIQAILQNDYKKLKTI